jgi:Fic family protein
VPAARWEPILYLSLYFKAHRQRYYELIDRVRATGDWESWLEFFLAGVKDTSAQASQSAHQILTLFEEDRRKIERLGRPAASIIRVHQHMQRKPILSIPATAEQLSVSAPTVGKARNRPRDYRKAAAPTLRLPALRRYFEPRYGINRWRAVSASRVAVSNNSICKEQPGG